MAALKASEDETLWPITDPSEANWPSQTTSHITLFLQQAICHVAGSAPINEERIAESHENQNAPFKVPVPVELDDDYRGNGIMQAVGSPARHLHDAHQHWNARNYLVNHEYDMGAVIDIRDEAKRGVRGIEVCEMLAFTILLDRQTGFRPDKQKLKAWAISIRADYFRVLEAYLDQGVNPYVFYFSIVDEQDWKQAGKKNLEGNDKEWEWLLLWAFPQQCASNYLVVPVAIDIPSRHV
ncbi:hypothetical protein PG989_015563 [Apiospora arundinis]